MVHPFLVCRHPADQPDAVFLNESTRRQHTARWSEAESSVVGKLSIVAAFWMNSILDWNISMAMI